MIGVSVQFVACTGVSIGFIFGGKRTEKMEKNVILIF